MTTNARPDLRIPLFPDTPEGQEKLRQDFRMLYLDPRNVKFREHFEREPDLKAWLTKGDADPIVAPSALRTGCLVHLHVLVNPLHADFDGHGVDGIMDEVEEMVSADRWVKDAKAVDYHDATVRARGHYDLGMQGCPAIEVDLDVLLGADAEGSTSQFGADLADVLRHNRTVVDAEVYRTSSKPVLIDLYYRPGDAWEHD